MNEINLQPGDRLFVSEAVDISLVPGSGPVFVGIPKAVEFRLPIGNLDKPWYVAHYAPQYGHYAYHPPCADWNLESGGNTDLGEPLVAPFSGIVLSAHDWRGGTGRVIQILGVNSVGHSPGGTLIVWSGWHLEDMAVLTGDIVEVGDPIGAIGNADGRYAGAHLHEQICIVNEWGIPTPATFVSDSRYAWQDCIAFYLTHGVNADLISRMTEYDGQ